MGKQKAILKKNVRVSEIFGEEFHIEDMITFEKGSKVTVLKRYYDKDRNLNQSVIFSKKLGEATVVADMFLDFVEKEEKADL